MELYLDSAASTPVKDEVLQVFNDSVKAYANPSSMHTMGQNAKHIIDETKSLIASKLNCNSNDLYFTSGSTMSNNIAIQGFVHHRNKYALVTSTVEHNDINMLADYLYANICHVRKISVDSNGYLNLQELIVTLEELSKFGFRTIVSIQMANSETGIIQPIREIAKLVHRYDGFVLHTDATQYIPYYPIDVQRMGIDMLSMSGQKIGGIKGSGLLYVKKGTPLHPIIWGEQGLVGGTYATPLIASLGKAFELIDYSVENELRNKRDYMIKGLRKLGGHLVGSENFRLPNNIYVWFENIQGYYLVNLLDGFDIYTGTGSACSSESNKPSHVAIAYGLTEEEAMGCIRFTINNEITYEQIDSVLNTVKVILDLLQ